jgi:hypothetical protein
LWCCRSYYERQYHNVSVPISPWSARTKTPVVGSWSFYDFENPNTDKGAFVLEAKTATYGAKTLWCCRAYYERQDHNISASISPWSARTKTPVVGALSFYYFENPSAHQGAFVLEAKTATYGAATL